MADYIIIENRSKKGNFGISEACFAAIAENVVSNISDFSSTPDKNKSHLAKPIKASIHRGIVHISLSVNALKGSDLQALSLHLQNEINSALAESLDQIPFDIQVKYNKII